MKKINSYIIEKLRINKDSKLDNNDYINNIEYVIENFLVNKFNIKNTEYQIDKKIEDKYFSFQIFFDKKYDNDNLYVEIFKKTKNEILTYDDYNLEQSWTDYQTTSIFFRFKKIKGT